MQLPAPKLREAPVAHGTFIWPFSGMTSPMTAEAEPVTELLTAFLASKWLLSRVQPHVYVEVTLFGEARSAFAARVRFLSGMKADVPSETAFNIERRVTFRALIRSILIVRTLVIIQFGRTEKFLLTL